jgi:3,4-dihydroxyphenylacetate 2,3-dioxygenase
MGTIAGAAIVGHVPTIMLPEETRIRLGGGRDTTLVSGLRELKDRLAGAGVDILVIVDTHWFTTAEHIVGGQDHHRGSYTSDELPKVIRNLAYDYPGAPALGATIQQIGRARGVRVLNTTDADIAHHYPTLNLVHHLHRGERVLSTGVCQTADRDDFVEFGSVIGEAVTALDDGSRVAILASGGLSHRFWPLREFMDHCHYDPDHVISPEARAFDEWVVEMLVKGDHAAVIDRYDEYRAHAPEGFFGHYLTMAGALGGRDWTTGGEALSDYENSYGTGQVIVWFPC